MIQFAPYATLLRAAYGDEAVQLTRDDALALLELFDHAGTQDALAETLARKAFRQSARRRRSAWERALNSEPADAA